MIEPTDDWFIFTIDGLDASPTPASLARLNAEPAGSRGFIRAASSGPEAGHFVDAQGKRVRFFGTNLTGSACFPEKQDASPLARHLRKLGFNLVRLHFMDVPSPRGLFAEDGVSFDAAQLDKLDALVHALYEEGIYVNINLHVGRRYPGIEGEAARRFPFGKVLDRFYPPFIQLQKDYARALLSHRNPYTGRAYADDPGVFAVELNNENTLLPFWGGDADALPEPFASELTKQWNTWLKAKYGATGPRRGLSELDDHLAFLRDTELAATRLIAMFVRRDLGVRSMIVNTQANYGGLAGVLREASVSDYIDMHNYWTHPRFPHGWDPVDWTTDNRSQIADGGGGALATLARHRVAHLPFSVSEYNTPAPSDYAAETFPLLGVFAAFQDWDAIVAYTYADFHRSWGADRILGFFDLNGNPAQLVFAPVAALAFRQGLVARGVAPLSLALPRDEASPAVDERAVPRLWDEAGVPGLAAAGRRLEIHLLPGLAPARVSEQVSPTQEITSDTGEITWRAQPPASFQVRAPSLRVAAGAIARSRVGLGDVTIEVGPVGQGHAVVALAALDEAPIAASRSLLLSVAARVENQGMGWDEGRHTVHDAWGHGPTRAERVPLRVELPGGGWRARPLDARGAPTGEVASAAPGERSHLDLTTLRPSLWYWIAR